MIETVNQAQWGDCSSPEDDLFYEDDVADDSDMNQEQALVTVNPVDNLIGWRLQLSTIFFLFVGKKKI